ncbi:MAG TPA: PDZ domain-containing protein, partial [Candidatus Sulfotelmatobacter sp.]|nr:PDZ domain-containing protein [Candidatus Sulfotelmatobacter sp.]
MIRIKPQWLLAIFLCLASVALAGRTNPVAYQVSLADPTQHLVHVEIVLPGGDSTQQLQMPVWNALYQVRDFSQYILWVRANNSAGKALPIRSVSKSLWEVSEADAGSRVIYEIYADQPGPYGAQLNEHHAFFNLAEILMYPVRERSEPVRVSFESLPAGWHVATPLNQAEGAYVADNYDRLVDSPVEIGEFEESDFDQGGGHYRVIVDADATTYEMDKLLPVIRRIVDAETAWMNDRPFETYTFIYHFPKEPGGGGMEHAYSTAIDINAQTLADNFPSFSDVTAHEFFHLWNVKRIRPQSLEPVDYTKEDYSDALWFSEGVTNTVQDIALLRAGLLDEPEYLRRLANDIGVLERRPAHLTQSAEESSLSAWLEKYSYYRQPERSVSYYNKGELLGVMLDLAMRDGSHNTASLRDLFLAMNADAKQGKFFADSEGVREAAERVSHTDLKSFFDQYVAGMMEIPWNDYFKTVGLRLVSVQTRMAGPSFAASRTFGSPPVVNTILPGGEADRAGLKVGDSVLQMNGRAVGGDFNYQLAQLRAGDTIRLRIRNAHGEREVHWKLDGKEQVEFRLEDV